MARSVVCYNGAAFDYSGGAITTFPGAVTSVFGRTGAVVATNGDYTAAQVGALSSAATFSGDGTGTVPALTLATTGVSAATYGDSTHVGQVAVDAKGRITSASNVAIAFPADAVTSVFGRTGAVVAASNDYSISQINGAAAAIGGALWTVLTKASDTSRTSTTSVAADPELGFVSTSGAFYEFEATLIFTGASGTPDLKFTFAEDATLRGMWTVMSFLSTADGVVAVAQAACQTGSVNAIGAATTVRGALCKGWLLGNAGTFSLYWSQNTSSVDATTMKTGSVLRYRRVV